MELEVTVGRLVVNSHDSSTVVSRCRQQTRPLTTTTTSFVDNAIDLPWRNFLNPEFGTKVPEGSNLIFGDTQISL